MSHNWLHIPDCQVLNAMKRLCRSGRTGRANKTGTTIAMDSHLHTPCLYILQGLHAQILIPQFTDCVVDCAGVGGLVVPTRPAPPLPW